MKYNLVKIRFKDDIWSFLTVDRTSDTGGFFAHPGLHRPGLVMGSVNQDRYPDKDRYPVSLSSYFMKRHSLRLNRTAF